MPRVFKLACVVALAVALLAYAGYGTLMRWSGRTPEGYRLLTAMPGVAGFEPTRLPAGPVLGSQSARDLAVNFGYRVGGVARSYALVLDFPRGAEEGRATLVARLAGRTATSETAAVRRLDAPRRAYAVALQGAFPDAPGVPALCVKAVIGPSLVEYQLAEASICVAQRDGEGLCHPETLACGLIRP